MKNKSSYKFSTFVFLSLLVIGLATSVSLVQRPQKINPSAAAPSKLPNPTATFCTCVGPGNCAIIKTYSNCLATNNRCSWSCPSTPIPVSKPVIVTPNGGEIWERGKTYQITWKQPSKASSTGLFLYTRNTNGVDSYLGAIAYNVSNVIGLNTYSWTIPPLGSSQTSPPNGNNIIVSVAQYDSSGSRIIEDKSDLPFSVFSP